MHFNFGKGICTCFLILQSFFFFSQTVPLRFQGNVSEDNVDLTAASIQITQAGKIINTVTTDRTGNYSFELPIGGDYEVVVSKDGYVPKKFTVSTTGIPPEKANTKFPIVEAKLSLFKKMDGVDYSWLNKPMNKFSYNEKKDNFEYDKNYLEQMLNAMEGVKEAERLIKEKEK